MRNYHHVNRRYPDLLTDSSLMRLDPSECVFRDTHPFRDTPQSAHTHTHMQRKHTHTHTEDEVSMEAK